MTNYSESAARDYSEYVSLVRDGVLPFEPVARKIAAEHNFPIEPLDAAVVTAYKRLISIYIEDIRGGRIDLAASTYELAHRIDFRVSDIDAALEFAKCARQSSQDIFPRPDITQ